MLHTLFTIHCSLFTVHCSLLTHRTAEQDGNIIARGHNCRVQNGDPTSHGETQCIRNAGRRRDWSELTLVTTLSPCPMCAGECL